MAWQDPGETGTGSWRSTDPPGGRRRELTRRELTRRGEPGRELERRNPGEQRAGAVGWPEASEDRPVRRRAAQADDDMDAELWEQPGPRTGFPEDPGTDSWRREPQRDLDADVPEEDEDVTELHSDPERGDWRRGDAARGAAGYREGHTDDWRRELAAQSDLADGESRRFGTSDFPPFRPPGGEATQSGAPRGGAGARAPRAAAQPEDARESREQLLVRSGGGWQDPPDTQWPPRRTGDGLQRVAGPYERRPVSSLAAPAGRQRDLLEPDDEEIEDTSGGPLAAVGYTVVWYGVPVVLFVLYMLALNRSQQSHALNTLASAAPQFGLSLLLSMVVAVGLRWASGTWKAASVGLAAAVMGGGLATVLTSAITGQSLS